MKPAPDVARILVVDDDPDIRGLTEAVLADAGYQVGSAGSGDQALRDVAERRYDLVLLDVNMPGMDGWETLRLIRADDALDHLPVVMFTVKGELHDKMQGLQDGAADYVTKPFVVDQLLERVGRVLETRR